MTYQNKLIQFMNNKKKKIEEIAEDINALVPSYFTKKDIENIHKWNNEKAKEIWELLCENIKKEAANLSSSTCPYCIYTNNQCQECTYAKIHGVCSHPDSTYKVTVHTIPTEPLDSDFYIHLIKKIEQEKWDIRKYDLLV